MYRPALETPLLVSVGHNWRLRCAIVRNEGAHSDRFAGAQHVPEAQPLNSADGSRSVERSIKLAQNVLLQPPLRRADQPARGAGFVDRQAWLRAASSPTWPPS
jgi:hypothetical protein